MSATALLPSSSKKLYAKRVLVIGGTKGIGFAVACAGYDNGAQVIISSSSQANVASAVEQIRNGYPLPPPTSTIEGFVCDLSDPITLEKALEILLDQATKAGALDHIAYTAGDAINFAPLAEITVDLIQKGGIVRFVAPLMLAKLIVRRRSQDQSLEPYLRAVADASITFTTGTGHDKPEGPGWEIIAGYIAGLEGAIRAMAFDLKPTRVNAVSPGAILTELISGWPEERLERLRKESLTGRIGETSDIAEAYIYCMRDGNYTGKVLQSDGGRLLGFLG